VTLDYLVVDEEKIMNPVSEDIAQRMHHRRIKSVVFKEAISIEELIAFLYAVVLPVKDFMDQDGVRGLLSKAGFAHLTVEELDYSLLLKTNTGQIRDIWMFLLKKSSQEHDSRKMQHVVNNFGRMMSYLPVEQLLENSEFRENIQRFLKYIKTVDPEGFEHCSQEMARHILNSKAVFTSEDLEKIKIMFRAFGESDFASVLTDEILNVDAFDQVSFNLFCRIIDVDNHTNIAALTAQTLNEKFVGDKTKVCHKLESILAKPQETEISQTYHQTLAGYLKDLSSESSFTFDRERLYSNYREILGYFFAIDMHQESLTTLCDKIAIELEGAGGDIEYDYIRRLLHLIHAKTKADPRLGAVLEKLLRQITSLIEKQVIADNFPEQFKDIIDLLPGSSVGIEVYLSTIFEERRLTTGIVRLFLKFFPDKMGYFYSSLEEQRDDIEFLESFIEQCASLEHNLALEIMENIYEFSNSYIKLEVLHAFRKSEKFNKSFILSVVRSGIGVLKKEALLIAKQDTVFLQEALGVLFDAPGLWGRKKLSLLEDITIVDELSLRAAEPQLKAIEKKCFIWNWGIKKRIGVVLRKWK
jgi:hypothetical protein